jgi:D-inositol-3-phosphate glycosyltransferase
MDPVKGFDTLLRAVSLLPSSQGARLLLVGGDNGDQEHDRLRGLADDLGLDGRVTFVGAIPQQQLPLYYSAASLVVVPSHYESFGFVAAEALACGTPVIASKVGGLPTIVQDGENGLLVPWRRPEAFAERIAWLLTDREMLRQLTVGARASVERLSWGSAAERTIRLYRQLGEARCPETVCSCGT